MAAVLASVFVHLGIKKKLEHGVPGKKQPPPSRRGINVFDRVGGVAQTGSAAAW
jgi:hypothetical protein